VFQESPHRFLSRAILGVGVAFRLAVHSFLVIDQEQNQGENVFVDAVGAALLAADIQFQILLDVAMITDAPDDASSIAFTPNARRELEHRHARRRRQSHVVSLFEQRKEHSPNANRRHVEERAESGLDALPALADDGFRDQMRRHEILQNVFRFGTRFPKISKQYQLERWVPIFREIGHDGRERSFFQIGLSQNENEKFAQSDDVNVEDFRRAVHFSEIEIEIVDALESLDVGLGFDVVLLVRVHLFVDRF